MRVPPQIIDASGGSPSANKVGEVRRPRRPSCRSAARESRGRARAPEPSARRSVEAFARGRGSWRAGRCRRASSPPRAASPRRGRGAAELYMSGLPRDTPEECAPPPRALTGMAPRGLGPVATRQASSRRVRRAGVAAMHYGPEPWPAPLGRRRCARVWPVRRRVSRCVSRCGGRRRARRRWRRRGAPPRASSPPARGAGAARVGEGARGFECVRDSERPPSFSPAFGRADAGGRRCAAPRAGARRRRRRRRRRRFRRRARRPWPRLLRPRIAGT